MNVSRVAMGKIGTTILLLTVLSACGKTGTRGSLAGSAEDDSAKSSAYVNSLAWAGSDHSLTAKLPCDDPNCDTDSVWIRITPRSDMNTLPIDAVLKPGGPNSSFAVAKIENLDQTHRAHGFNLDAGETGYLWAGPTVHHGRRFAVYSKDWKLLAIATKASYCPKGNQADPEVHVPPPPCPKPYESLYDSSGVQQKSAASLPRDMYFLASNTRLTAATAMIHLSTLWFSCSGGCCEAGGFTEVQ